MKVIRLPFKNFVYIDGKIGFIKSALYLERIFSFWNEARFANRGEQKSVYSLLYSAHFLKANRNSCFSCSTKALCKKRKKKRSIFVFFGLQSELCLLRGKQIYTILFFNALSVKGKQFCVSVSFSTDGVLRKKAIKLEFLVPESSLLQRKREIFLLRLRKSKRIYC